MGVMAVLVLGVTPPWLLLFNSDADEADDDLTRTVARKVRGGMYWCMTCFILRCRFCFFEGLDDLDA
jgi:hypothetical protein